MHHKATITVGSAFGKPYHVVCSCGTGGDFPTEREAVNWINAVHFSRLGGVSTTEIYVPGAQLKAPSQAKPTELSAKVFDQKQPAGASVAAHVAEGQQKGK